MWLKRPRLADTSCWGGSRQVRLRYAVCGLLVMLLHLGISSTLRLESGRGMLGEWCGLGGRVRERAQLGLNG